MSPEKPRAVMSFMRACGPRLMVAIQAMLQAMGVPLETQVHDLPHRSDFVIWAAGIVLLVDGDFWQGWEFEKWGAQALRASGGEICVRLQAGRTQQEASA